LESLLKALTAELCSCLQLTTTPTLTPTSPASTTNDNTKHNGGATAACWMDQTPLQLSPSQSYRLALVTACLHSSMANLNLSVLVDADVDVDILFPTTAADGVTDTDSTGERRTVSLPAPILLLDEWMDNETTEIIQTVQRGLEQLAAGSGCCGCGGGGGGGGAVIVSATHKADRWKKPYSEVVLSRGQVLSRNRIGS
jgi:hypothetical protein